MSRRRHSLAAAVPLATLLAATFALRTANANPQPAMDEFTGPLPHWLDLRKDCGAIGDGVADDTPAFLKAFATIPEHGKAKPNDKRVLFLPAGTYRITQPLVLQNRMAIAILGEHPERTRIIYDGPANEIMLQCVGVSYSKFGRITWDGRRKARAAVAHQWDPIAKIGPAVTYMEHADQVFQDVGKGIIGGRVVPIIKDGQITWYNHGMDAETIVRRCRFIRCSDVGLSIESFNALDWWVWDSEFVDCTVGITNTPKGEYGGGHFHVYRSLFRNSRETDIRIGHSSYFGIRLNTSINSNRFIEAIRPPGYGKDNYFGRWNPEDKHGAKLLVQGNTILDPRDTTAIALDQHGPLLLVDNTFTAKPAGAKPIIRVSPPTDGAQVISIGNTFKGAQQLEVRGDITSIDDRFTDYIAPNATFAAPTPAPTPTRRIFALTPQSTTAEIQKTIDEAAALRGQKPIIYFPAGRYAIDTTLTIPANADLQIVGDGNESTLLWEGPDAGTMLRLAGPTRATLRDFSISGIGSKKKTTLDRGIVVTNADQPNGQILLDQANVGNCVRAGLAIRGLASTQVQAMGVNTAGTTAGPGLLVEGSGKPDASATVGWFGGSGSNNQQTHLVRNGGNLVVWDTWYETAPNKPEAEPRYIHLTDRGNLTLFGGQIATLPGKDARRDIPAIDLDNFNGSLVLLGTNLETLNRQVRITGDNPLKFLALAVQFSKIEPILDNNAANADVYMIACRQAQENASPKPLPPIGKLDAAFIRKALAPARQVLPTAWNSAPGDATDLRIHRVSVRYRIGEGMVFLGAEDK